MSGHPPYALISTSLFEWLAHPLLILTVTAVLTGLLVPLIKARMDDRKLRDQKRFDAELLRQSKVIDSQAELLSDLSEHLWSWQMLSIGLTYYSLNRDEERFAKSLHEYMEGQGDFFAKFRVLISKVRLMASPTTAEAFQELFDKWLGDIDPSLLFAVRNNPNGPFASSHRPETIREMHQILLVEVPKEIEATLGQLAREVRLTQTVVSPSSDLRKSPFIRRRAFGEGKKGP